LPAFSRLAGFQQRLHGSVPCVLYNPLGLVSDRGAALMVRRVM
jgi:hypothetical protein